MCCCSRDRATRRLCGRGTSAPLAAEASASWLLGIGGSAAYIALRGDRADLPGPAVSYIVLGTAWLAGAAGYGADFHSTAAAVPYVLFAISVLAVGVTGGSRGGRAATARRRGFAQLAGRPTVV